MRKEERRSRDRREREGEQGEGAGGRENKRKSEKGGEERRAEKPANRQESETLAISACVHGVQRKGETCNGGGSHRIAPKGARENA